MHRWNPNVFFTLHCFKWKQYNGEKTWSSVDAPLEIRSDFHFNFNVDGPLEKGSLFHDVESSSPKDVLCEVSFKVAKQPRITMSEHVNNLQWGPWQQFFFYQKSSLAWALKRWACTTTRTRSLKMKTTYITPGTKFICVCSHVVWCFGHHVEITDT